MNRRTDRVFQFIRDFLSVLPHCDFGLDAPLNRELGLELSFLADWYGQNMEIIR